MTVYLIIPKDSVDNEAIDVRHTRKEAYKAALPELEYFDSHTDSELDELLSLKNMVVVPKEVK